MNRNFTVTQCGVSTQVTATSNTQITFITVPCATVGNSDVTVSFNNQNATLTYTYTTPSGGFVITGITPQNYSPVLKGFMNITGTGFGTDTSALTVWLTANDTNIYQLNVL